MRTPVLPPDDNLVHLQRQRQQINQLISALHQNLETSFPDDASQAEPTINKDSTNNSDIVDNYYFSSSSVHVSRYNVVAKCNHVLSTSTHSDNFFIPNSDTTHNMFKYKKYFESLQSVLDTQGNQACVKMGDSHLTAIKGYGKAYFEIDGKKVAKYGYHVPTLNDSLFSIQEYSSHPACQIHLKKSQSIPAFPTFMVDLITGQKIFSPISPFSPHQQVLTFDDDTSKLNHPL